MNARTPEPELYSVNSNPVAPVVEILTAQQRMADQCWALAKANQTIRGCLRPTREQVLSALDAVESMAQSLIEISDVGNGLDVEDAFCEVRKALDAIRYVKTHEEAIRDAQDHWNELRRHER